MNKRKQILSDTQRDTKNKKDRDRKKQRREIEEVKKQQIQQIEVTNSRLLLQLKNVENFQKERAHHIEEAEKQLEIAKQELCMQRYILQGEQEQFKASKRAWMNEAEALVQKVTEQTLMIERLQKEKEMFARRCSSLNINIPVNRKVCLELALKALIVIFFEGPKGVALVGAASTKTRKFTALPPTKGIKYVSSL